MGAGQPLHANQEEADQRRSVLTAIIEAVRAERAIKLPEFDPVASLPGDSALVTVGIEPNPYGGTVGEYRYQFEGEEDLLHLIVTRLDGGVLSPEEGQRVAGFLLDGVSHALVWIRPGEFSQHFYLAHDHLVESVRL